MSIWIIFTLLGSLALLMYGMKSMSEALQKMAGPQLRHVLGAMTTNRFTGMLTGMLVTASVQSSTATTVMTVSFVNAGLLTLAQAISVIMGANIGTTLTAWIMSAGMSFDVGSLAYPAFLIGIILIYQKKYRYIGDFLFGLAFLIFALATLRVTGQNMHLGENQTVLDFFASFDPNSFLTTLIFLLLGGVLTFCVQSSAAVMAITMILCSSGALPIYQGIALVMGENIGTTVTSNLAAMSANTQARRAALAHMFFNVFGVVWILFVFRPFIDMVCGWVGYDVNMTMEVAGAHAFMANAAKLSFVLAAFHTSFNVANTFILIWFIPQIERFVCWVIKPKKVDEEEDFRLHFITAGFMKTPSSLCWRPRKRFSILPAVCSVCSVWFASCCSSPVVVLPARTTRLATSTSSTPVLRSTKVSATIWSSRLPNILSPSVMPTFLTIRRPRFVPCCVKSLSWSLSVTPVSTWPAPFRVNTTASRTTSLTDSTTTCTR